MSKIQTYLNNILSARYGKDVRQSIHDAIEEIDSVASTAQDSAEKMAQIATENAEQTAINTESAKIYAEQAKKYRDEAENFTPEGYAELQENVSDLNIKVDTIIEKADLRIKNTATGESIHVTDSADSKVVEFALYGKGKQKRYSGKNRLNNTATTTTLFTVHDDKSVTVNGTSTARTAFTLARNINIPVGSYILSESSEGADGLFHEVSIVNSEGVTRYVNGGAYKPLAIDIAEGEYISSCHLIVNSGMTFNNVTVYPMIRLASIEDDTYEPFTGNQPSPNPEYQQDVEISGASGSVEVKSVGKNWLKNTATNQTVLGVDYVVNNDKSVTANGTSSGWSAIKLPITLEQGKYILNACPAGGGYNKYIGYINSKYFGITYTDSGSGVTLNVTEKKSFDLELVVYEGYTANNLTFYPMIRRCDENGNPIDDDTYEPYKETTTTILTPNGLAGIPVESGGNYTDSDGQQWISDVVYKYADGSGKRVQRVGKAFLNGNEVWNVGSLPDDSPYKRYFIRIVDFEAKKLYTPVCCSHFTQYGMNAWYADTEGIYLNTIDVVNLDVVSKIQTLEEWKTWLSENTPTLYYILATPIITDLTAEEIAEIERLHTFYPVTNISNDSDCGMALTYLCDGKNYIDNKLALIESALISSI